MDMMDKQLRSDQARRNFRGLLDEVEHHDVHITILRYDQPAAVLVSPQWYEEAKAQIAALAWIVEREQSAGSGTPETKAETASQEHDTGSMT
jgi:prevent-host-death family protein